MCDLAAGPKGLDRARPGSTGPQVAWPILTECMDRTDTWRTHVHDLRVGRPLLGHRGIGSRARGALLARQGAVGPDRVRGRAPERADRFQDGDRPALFERRRLGLLGSRGRCRPLHRRSCARPGRAHRPPRLLPVPGGGGAMPSQLLRRRLRSRRRLQEDVRGLPAGRHGAAFRTARPPVHAAQRGRELRLLRPARHGRQTDAHVRDRLPAPHGESVLRRIPHRDGSRPVDLPRSSTP